MILLLLVQTLVLWALLSALCIYAWRALDSFLSAKGFWA